MTDSIRSLQRAHAFVNSLRASVKEAFDSGEAEVSVVAIADEWLFIVAKEPALIDDWDHDACDAFAKMRSSLEFLAHSLAIAHQGKRLEPSQARKTSFPIYSDPAPFNQWKKKVKTLYAPQVLQRIEEIQLFNATNSEQLGPAAGEYFPHARLWSLYIIDEYAKRGRHQILERVSVNFNFSRPPESAAGRKIINSSCRDQGVAPGTCVGTWGFDGVAPPVPDCGVPTPPLVLEFAKKMWTWPDPAVDTFAGTPSALDVLESGLGTVETLLRMFEPAMTGQDPLPATFLSASLGAM